MILYRFELAKLASQWRLRGLLLACAVAPGAYTAIVSRQSALPADTVYGRWMDQSGWAGSLVVLAFAGALVLPLLASVVAGDVFAVEDRLGTWRHLLLTTGSPRRVFVAKAAAAATLLLALLVLLALSATAGGLLSVGASPLAGLDGHPMSGADLGVRVALAWLSVVPPVLAFAAVGLLGSVALGRSPFALLLPVVVALVLEGVQLLPVPVALRLALPTSAFTAYRGLFVAPSELGPLWVGLAVSLAWTALATAAAYRVFARRDFSTLADDGSGRRVAGGLAPLAVGTVLATLAIGVLSGGAATGANLPHGKVEAALASSFAHLYVLQTERLHRPPVTVEQMHTTANCDRGGPRVEDDGPGTDWRCTVTWTLPGTTATGTATYQLEVAADGRLRADGDGPREVNGNFTTHGELGDLPNPLWQFDASVDLLSKETPQEGTA